MLSRKLIASGIVLTSLLSQGTIPEKISTQTLPQRIIERSRVVEFDCTKYNPKESKQKHISTYWDSKQERLSLIGYPTIGWETSIQKDCETQSNVFDFEMDYRVKVQILEIYQEHQKKNKLRLVNFPTYGWTLSLADQDQNGIPDHLNLIFPEEAVSILEKELEIKLSEKD